MLHISGVQVTNIYVVHVHMTVWSICLNVYSKQTGIQVSQVCDLAATNPGLTEFEHDCNAACLSSTI